MFLSQLFSILAGIAQGYGFISLLYKGDASQTSLKMMHIKFVSAVMAFGGGFFAILMYVLGTVFFGMLISLFHFPINYLGKWFCPANQMFNTNPYHASYTTNKAQDAFPYHWVVIVGALVLTYLLIFLPGGLMDGCTTSSYFGAGFWGCSSSIGRLMTALLLPFGYVMQYIMMRGVVQKGAAILATARHFVLSMLVSEILFLVVAIWFSSFSPGLMYWTNLASRAASVVILLLHTLWQGLCFRKCCGHCATGGTPPPVTGSTPAGDALDYIQKLRQASSASGNNAPMTTEQPKQQQKKKQTNNESA